MMDRYDMEIQRMLKHKHNYYTEPLNEENLEKIPSFVEKYEGKEVLLIHSVLNDGLSVEVVKEGKIIKRYDLEVF